MEQFCNYVCLSFDREGVEKTVFAFMILEIGRAVIPGQLGQKSSRDLNLASKNWAWY
jgi:hypothetical protein